MIERRHGGCLILAEQSRQEFILPRALAWARP
jgi:hypothetical protein